MKKHILPIVMTLVILAIGPIMSFTVSSAKVDAAMAQVKTGENAILERSFVVARIEPILPFVQVTLIGLVWALSLKPKNKNEEAPNS